jgi:hypothetical protein
MTMARAAPVGARWRFDPRHVSATHATAWGLRGSSLGLLTAGTRRRGLALGFGYGDKATFENRVTTNAQTASSTTPEGRQSHLLPFVEGGPAA